MPAYRVDWQVLAGIDEVTKWSAVVVAESEDDARQLVRGRIRPEEMAPDAVRLHGVEELRPGFFHVQKGSLWGEPWSVELALDARLDEDQLAVVARRLARFEMTPKVGGEAVQSIRLSVPAHDADEARASAVELVRGALAGAEDVEVRALSALPLWAWEQRALDST